MRTLLIICGIALAIAGFFWLSQQSNVASSSLCVPNEACIREWIAATSGWAAVIAALLTIFYLSKQIRDADRHQRTAFTINLRQQRILAIRTAQIASIALGEISKQEREHADADIRSWDRETVEGIIHHLRDTTISTFQSEIAHPHSLNAWATSLIVERAYAGVEPPLQKAPEFTRKFFENLASQAGEFLADIDVITGHKPSPQSEYRQKEDERSRFGVQSSHPP